MHLDLAAPGASEGVRLVNAVMAAGALSPLGVKVTTQPRFTV